MSPAECQSLLDGFGGVSEAQRVLSAGGEFGPFIMHVVTSFEGSAALVVEQFAAQTAQCPRGVVENPDGSRTEFTNTDVPFPALEDATFAVCQHGVNGSVDVYLDAAVVASGPDLVFVGTISQSPVPRENLEATVALAVAKLKSVR